jgi:hypothetical protein
MDYRAQRFHRLVMNDLMATNPMRASEVEEVFPAAEEGVR